MFLSKKASDSYKLLTRTNTLKLRSTVLTVLYVNHDINGSATTIPIVYRLRYPSEYFHRQSAVYGRVSLLSLLRAKFRQISNIYLWRFYLSCTSSVASLLYPNLPIQKILEAFFFHSDHW